jgi:hypothetical protein
MSLMAQAAADLRTFLEDTSSGFGLPFEVVAPDGTTAELKGFSADIGHTIDPETGLAVSGRSAHVSLPVAACREAFGTLPESPATSTTPPWRVTVELPTAAAPILFYVTHTAPDLLGVVVCSLAVYDGS